jgi:Cu/Ag efflux protein CusF
MKWEERRSMVEMIEDRRASTARKRPSIWGLVSGWMLILGLVAHTGGCTKEPASPQPAGDAVREYSLRGRVETIDLTRKRAVIAHEEIPGYMKPMTMSFSIPDEEALKPLRSGDQIEARLHFDPRTNLSWLEEVQVVEAPSQQEPPPGS